MRRFNRYVLTIAFASSALAWAPWAIGQTTTTPVRSLQKAPVGPDGFGQPLTLQAQGSFFAGGTLLTGANGDTFHGDAAWVEFDIPPRPHKYPMVMWHGGGQESKTWESTPDGRDGYEQIFARRGFSTYVIDQPRRGNASRPIIGTTIPDGSPGESTTFNVFRLGTWVPPAAPQFFKNVQFPKNVPGAMDQYDFQATANTGPENIDEPTRELMANSVVSLFQKIGPGVLLTHSNSGQYGWTTGILAPTLIRAIVAYEPAAYAFPSNGVPPVVNTANAEVAAVTAPQIYTPAQFQNLTKMPIVIFFGDNIDFTTPSTNFGVELWRVVTQRAQQFVDAVNRRGGHAQIIYLPQVGLTGNTHFAFSDLNNVGVADVLSKWLHQNNLDQ